jgi:hypothetical protein
MIVERLGQFAPAVQEVRAPIAPVVPQILPQLVFSPEHEKMLEVAKETAKETAFPEPEKKSGLLPILLIGGAIFAVVLLIKKRK